MLRKRFSLIVVAIFVVTITVAANGNGGVFFTEFTPVRGVEYPYPETTLSESSDFSYTSQSLTLSPDPIRWVNFRVLPDGVTGGLLVKTQVTEPTIGSYGSVKLYDVSAGTGIAGDWGVPALEISSDRATAVALDNELGLELSSYQGSVVAIELGRLQLNVSAPATVFLGSVITYEVTLTNTAPFDIWGAGVLGWVDGGEARPPAPSNPLDYDWRWLPDTVVAASTVTTILMVAPSVAEGGTVTATFSAGAFDCPGELAGMVITTTVVAKPEYWLFVPLTLYASDGG